MRAWYGSRATSVPQAADVVIPLEDGDVGVAEPPEEGGAADGGRAAAEQRHARPIAVRTLAGRTYLRRQHLAQTHLLEHLPRVSEVTVHRCSDEWL